MQGSSRTEAVTYPASSRGSFGNVRNTRDTYAQVKSELRVLIEDLARNGEPRLPPEDQLSSQLGVSRPTVRSALLSLQKEGRIQRLHGRGTFVNRHALRMAANIAEDRPFLELLESLGYDSTVRNLRIHTELAPADVSTALDLQAREEICVVERLFEASGRPAVLSFDHVPVGLLEAAGDEVEGDDSTFAFVRRYTGRRVRYSIAEIVPVMPDEHVANRLGIAMGQALLRLSHTHIDTDDRPVAFTHAYVSDSFIRFSVVRMYTDA